MKGSNSFAKRLRNNATDAERLLWNHIRKRQIKKIKFRRQQRIGKYIVDFISLENKLIIELDGGQHAENYAYDEKRDKFLRNEGYKVIRFWNHDVIKNTENILDIINDNC